MSQAALKLGGAPQRRHTPFQKNPTAFMVRTTLSEWDALKWAAENYGETIGQFAEDAILTWLDNKIDIPRRVFMPPLTNDTKRLHLDRTVVDAIDLVTFTDELDRPQPIAKSDIAMSAILSFVQGMLDNRPSSDCLEIPHGAAIIDKARPSLEVKLPQ